MSRAAAQPLADEVKAPSYNVPLKHVVSIEHPCVVKNLDHAYKSLGGEHQLRHLLTPNNDDAGHAAPVAVSLRPNDPLAKRISSTPLSSQNVLVKIAVPKRTGRKRKRGSDEPFEASSLPVSVHGGLTVADLLQTMRDNPENYVVEPIGMINETHRFETIPDFQTRASEVPILREIRDHAMKPKYDSFKDFRIDYRFGIDQNVAYPDPPSFIPTAETFDWQYDQKPDDSATRGKQYRGRPKLLPPPLQSVALSSDTLVVPQAPPPDSAEQSSSRILKAIDAVRELLETRPIVTMRALDAIIETTTMKAISWAVRYLGYYVTSGPWQGAVVKYGIDPRSDPRYRIYQTLNFTLGHNREINSALGKQGHANVVNSHIFDGKTLFGVGRNWQLCDLTDPMIQTLINSPEAIRPDCDMEQHGWLYNGIIAKVRVIMREKLVRIINGASLPQADYFSVLWQLPNQIDVPANCAVGDECGPEARQLARDVAKEALKGPPKAYEVLQRAADGGALPRAGSVTEGEDDEISDEEDADEVDPSLVLNEDDDVEDEEEDVGEEEGSDVGEIEEEDEDELEEDGDDDDEGEEAEEGEGDSNEEEEGEGEEDEDEEDAVDDEGPAIEPRTYVNWPAIDEE